MTKTLALTCAMAMAVYATACVLVYLNQERLLYYPTPEILRADARALRLRCGDATLKIWELHGEAKPALIYFGGNGEEVGANLPDFDAAFRDRAVYIVNYRGYGGSTGRPSEAALVSDAQIIYDHVAARHSGVAVIGRSLGSGVATALAASRPVERLVLVTPFDSIANVAADHSFWLPVRWLVRDRYDSARRIGGVRAPVLVVVAEHDEVIYRARSDALIAAIASEARVLVLPGATHNDVSAFPAYVRALKEFVAGR